MSYHCNNCGKEISFGESICPHCQADTTSVWDQASPKKEGPKVVPGTGVSAGGASPFPPPTGASPFPPPAGSSPFPPPASSAPVPVVQSGSYFEIPPIAGKLYLGADKPLKSYGREEIQGVATKALPDLNAYNNISRVRKDQSGNSYSEHFIIHYEKGEYKIEDLHSTNGTYLNNTKLKGLPPQPLKEGDKVILPIEEFGKMVQMEMIFHK